MKSLMFVAPGQLRFDEVDAPVIVEGTDALVRPLAATTCDLDHHVIDDKTPFSGFGPFPLGHECAGTVVEVGPDCTDVAVGDVVGVAWHIACGTCAQCRLGHTARCLRHGDAQYGLPVNGAWGGCFDELIRVPYADFNLAELPAGVDPVHLATLVGAGGVPYLALGRAPHGTALSGVDAAAAGVAFLLVLVRQTGHPRALPTSADLAAYRIIQEGLTLRSGFRMILQSEPDLEVVGEGAAVDPRVGAAVPFYGVIRGELPDFSGLKAEIQGHYAQTDVTVPARVPGRAAGDHPGPVRHHPRDPRASRTARLLQGQPPRGLPRGVGDEGVGAHAGVPARAPGLTSAGRPRPATGAGSAPGRRITWCRRSATPRGRGCGPR